MHVHKICNLIRGCVVNEFINYHNNIVDSRETGLVMSSSNPSSPLIGRGEVGSSLFDACRNGDIDRVKLLLTPDNVNARDVPGRKSSPLHFAAGR